MRGIGNLNYPTFNAVEAMLKYNDPNCEVINPAVNFNGDTDRPPSEYMAIDLQAVFAADVLVLLPGWEASEGASREVELAGWLDKKFEVAYIFENYWATRPLAGLPSRKQSERAEVLTDASAAITGDRNNSYGPPDQDFSRTAGALNAFGYRGPDGRMLKGHDIAIILMTVKTSRLMWTPTKRDSWLDIAGYSGCGYECAIEEAKRDLPAV